MRKKNNNVFYKSDDHVRSFGGKTSGFESKDEAMKEKKHLKAYLAGKTIYKHGFKTIKFNENEDIEVEGELEGVMTELEKGFEMRQPAYFEVSEIWTPKTSSK